MIRIIYTTCLSMINESMNQSLHIRPGTTAGSAGLFLEGRHLASDSLTESVQPRLDTKSRQYEDFEKPKCSEFLKHFSMYKYDLAYNLMIV